MKKNKTLMMGLSIALVIVLSIFGVKSLNKSKVINFQSKFLAYLSLETDVLYDRINGIIDDKEYVYKQRESLSNYKKLEVSAPSEVREIYKDFLEVYEYNVTNYAEMNSDKLDEQNNKASDLIDKINEMNEKYNINIEKRNSKVNNYIEKIKNN